MARTIEFGGAVALASVVEQGSFTAAARALRLPKSAVSRRVSDLEASLGVRLLQRTTRRLHLTEAGAAYYERARRALEAFAEADDAARDAQGAPRGRVTLTAPNDLGATLLAEPLARFHAAYPEIEVNVILTPRVLDLVAEGVDLALRAGKLGDSSLVARKIGVAEGLLVASPAYVAAHGAPRRPADLARHSAVVFRGMNRWDIEGPGGATTVEVGGAVAGDDITFVRECVIAGLGIGSIPCPIVRRALAEGRLVRVLPRFVHRAGDLHLLYPYGRFVPRRVGALADFLVKELPPELTAPGPRR
ncbi:MAG TPA: LysR family transcriptional regulator [Haliangiales bacterium]|nr:LysR family transcriptional regulator [Haliangiales bacterium]